ncbi:MAG: LamG-like jellyroll fold domain-containing protein [Planctomycetota bacterium]
MLGIDLISLLTLEDSQMTRFASMTGSCTTFCALLGTAIVPTTTQAALLNSGSATTSFSVDVNGIGLNGAADGDATWTGAGAAPNVWTFNTEQVTVNAVTESNTVIESAIDFDGALAANTPSPFANGTSTASFELFVRPDAGSNGAGRLLFETGGGGNGLSIGISDTAVLVSTEAAALLSASLAGIDTTDFIQIVVTHDGPGDLVTLYVNGNAVINSTDTLTESASEEVAGSNAASLGGLDTTSANGGLSTDPFFGEIAGFRYYNSVLDADDVLASYTAILIPEPGSLGLAAMGGLLCLIRRRR